MDWETDAKRWAKMLYNRPIITRVDYSVNNLKDDRCALMGKNSGGFLKRRLMSEMGANGKAILNGVDFEPISYEWAFMVLGGANTENRKGYQKFEQCGN